MGDVRPAPWGGEEICREEAADRVAVMLDNKLGRECTYEEWEAWIKDNDGEFDEMISEVMYEKGWE